jgi:hypothetical protein
MHENPPKFTRHAKERLFERKISKEQCLELFRSGLRLDSRSGCMKVYDKQLVLIVRLGLSSKIVTAYRICGNKRRSAQDAKM